VANAILSRIPSNRTPTQRDYEVAAAEVEKEWSFFTSLTQTKAPETTTPPSTNAPAAKTAPAEKPVASAPTPTPSRRPPPRKPYWGSSEYDAEVEAAMAEAIAIAKR
jgi:hypothetical protein